MIRLEKMESVVLVLPSRGQLSLVMSLSGAELGLKVLIRKRSSLVFFLVVSLIGDSISSLFFLRALIGAFSIISIG